MKTDRDETEEVVLNWIHLFANLQQELARLKSLSLGPHFSMLASLKRYNENTLWQYG